MFLRVLGENARKLRNLIQPHVVTHLGDSGQAGCLNDLSQKAPALDPERIDQVAALPLGARESDARGVSP